MPSSDQVRENLIRLIEGQQALDGRYTDIHRLNEEAGNGVFSLFFRASDGTTGDQVALKFFNPMLGQDIYRLRSFEREARLLVDLNGCDNILELVEPRKTFRYTLTDTNTGLPYPYDFQYFAVPLALRSLKDYTHSEDWNPTTALHYFREACKGVQRLHKRSICHRDIKLDNLLIFPRRVLRVSDFGAAKMLGDREPPLLDSYAGPVGDVRYTAPELLARLDFDDEFIFLSDMFALGASLFEVFTGTVLTLELYTLETMRELVAHFSLVPRATRKTVFDGVIGDFAARNPLPDIHTFTDRVPASIRPYLNRLYRRLAHLDYRYRDRDFVRTFIDIEICIKIAMNDRSYKRWLDERRRRHEAEAMAIAHD